MTKSERRKARKAAAAAGQPLTGDLALPDDRNQSDPSEVGPEYLSNGRRNHRRDRYLEKTARLAYEHDRDF